MNFTKSEQEAFVVEVTPELAKKMLGTSVGNRNLRAWWVKILTKLMLSGDFEVTHQGIAFDINGNLRDGHHRLTAVCLAGIPIKMWCTLGVTEKSIKSVDQGATRTLSDVLSIPKRIVEPIRLAAQIQLHQSKVTAYDVEEVGSTGLLDVMTCLINYTGSTRAYYSSAPMKLAVALRVMDGTPSEHAFEVYRTLVNFDIDNMCGAAKGLVRQVTDKKASSSLAYDVLARGLKVFDINRKDISKIQITDADVDAALAFTRSVISKNVRPI